MLQHFEIRLYYRNGLEEGKAEPEPRIKPENWTRIQSENLKQILPENWIWIENRRQIRQENWSQI